MAGPHVVEAQQRQEIAMRTLHVNVISDIIINIIIIIIIVFHQKLIGCLLNQIMHRSWHYLESNVRTQKRTVV